MAPDFAFIAPFAAFAVGVLATLAAMRRWLGRIEQPVGWIVIRPGPMHWSGMILAGGLIGMLAYVGLFVGSARADAAFQMQMLWLIVAGFAVCAAGCVWQIKQVVKTAARFRGSQVSFHRMGDGTRVTQSLSDVIEMRRPACCAIRIRFVNGDELRLDPYADNVPRLWERIVAIDES